MRKVFSDLKGKITFKFLVRIAFVALFLVAIFFALDWLGNFLGQEKIREIIYQAGIFGPLLYAAIYMLSIVIAPFPGFAAYVVTAGIYGVGKIVLFTYFLALLGATVNFYIARIWGRPVLRKLIGGGGVKKVDGLTKDFGAEVLILTRLFDGFLFEWISYVAGLTNMRYKTYIFITIWASIPYHIILFIFSSLISDLGRTFIAITAINYALLGMPIVYYLLKRTFSPNFANSKTPKR